MCFNTKHCDLHFDGVSNGKSVTADEEASHAPKAGSEERTSTPNLSPSSARAGDEEAEEAVSDESDDELDPDAEVTVEDPVDGGVRDNSGRNGPSTGDMRDNISGNGTSSGHVRDNIRGNGASSGDVRDNVSGRDSHPEGEYMEVLNHSGGSGDLSAGRSDHSTSADGS